LLAQSRLPVVDPAGLQGGGIEGIDFCLAFGSEGGVLFDGMGMKAINSENRMIQAITDAVSPMPADLASRMTLAPADAGEARRTDIRRPAVFYHCHRCWIGILCPLISDVD
jgi:hypothetical protein